MQIKVFRLRICNSRSLLRADTRARFANTARRGSSATRLVHLSVAAHRKAGYAAPTSSRGSALTIDPEVIPTASAREVFEVSLGDVAEEGAWALMLGCTVDALRRAVGAVGSDPECIRAHLLAS